MVKLFLLAIAGVTVVAGLVRAVEPRFAFFPTRDEQATPADFGRPFEATTLETDDGERIRAWLLPSAAPRAVVVYFHGNGGNLSVWLPILAGIQRRGFTVAAIDYRGYGASTGRPSERGLYKDVDTAIAWASRIAAPGVPLVYWGRSLGTAMAAYAATRRRPDRLILEAGFPRARSLLRASPPLAVVSLFSSYRFPTADYARHAGCPILVLHGDADRVIPFEHGRALFDGLTEPKRFVTIRGGDHNDAVPPDQDAYWSAIASFLE